MDLDASAVASLTGIGATNGMTTVERVPSTGACRCCITFFYDGKGRLRELVIIRDLPSTAAGRQLGEDIKNALDLPPPDLSAPGPDVALYRWDVPTSPGEQIGLDISVHAGRPTFRAAIVVLGRTK
jgi:hypothetical protein